MKALTVITIVCAGVGCSGQPPASEVPTAKTESVAQPIVAAKTASLVGDVFLTMRSGDVKRAADAEVISVPARPAFEAAWRSLIDSGRSDLKEAHGRLEVAEREEARLRAAESTAFGAYAADPSNEQKRDAYQMASIRDARGNIASSRTAISRLTSEYELRALALIFRSQARSTRTDVSGRFELAELPLGRAYVFSRYQVFDNHLFWFVDTELRDGSQRLNLSNSNLGWPLTPS